MEELDIRVADDAILQTTTFVHEVGKAFLKDGLSRTGRADHLAATLFGWIERGGRFLDAAGKVMKMPDDVVDEAYRQRSCRRSIGKCADETALREVWFSWNSSVKTFAARPPKRMPRASLLPRLRLIDLAYKVEGRSLT